MMIIVASSVDTYINIKYPITSTFEENPIARWVLLESDNDLALLISLKFFGLSLAIVFLMLLYLYNDMIAVLSSAGLAAIFGILIMYMVF